MAIFFCFTVDVLVLLSRYFTFFGCPIISQFTVLLCRLFLVFCVEHLLFIVSITPTLLSGHPLTDSTKNVVFQMDDQKAKYVSFYLMHRQSKDWHDIYF